MRSPVVDQGVAAGGCVVECAAYRNELGALCAGLRRDSGQDPEQFLEDAKARASRLPAAIRDEIYRFGQQGNRAGALLLKNLPVEHRGRRLPEEGWLALMGSCLGDLVGYLQEKNGALFHDITPTPSQERQQSSEGSVAPLDLHTERCFHPFLPDYVLLYCVRPDHERRAATTFASIRNILPLLPEQCVPALFEPEFRTGIDYSFGNVSNTKANGPVLSILYGDHSDPWFRWDLDLMEGLTPGASAALECLRRAAEEVTESVCLQPGWLLILDNRRAVHGRTAFEPCYDGADRLLKRAYVVADLGASAADREPGSRIIRTRFDFLP